MFAPDQCKCLLTYESLINMVGFDGTGLYDSKNVLKHILRVHCYVLNEFCGLLGPMLYPRMSHVHRRTHTRQYSYLIVRMLTIDHYYRNRHRPRHLRLDGYKT